MELHIFSARLFQVVTISFQLDAPNPRQELSQTNAGQDKRASNDDTGEQVPKKASTALLIAVGGSMLSLWLTYLVAPLTRDYGDHCMAPATHMGHCIATYIGIANAAVVGYGIFAMVNLLRRKCLSKINFDIHSTVPDRWLEEERARTGTEPASIKLWSSDRSQKVPLNSLAITDAGEKELMGKMWSANTFGIMWSSLDSTDKVLRLRAGIGTKAPYFQDVSEDGPGSRDV